MIDTNIEEPEFISLLIEMFKINGFSATYNIILNTAFPNNEDDFMRLFYDAENNKMNNPE